MRRGGSVRHSCACSREQKNREKFAQMRIWTAWRTSLRARLPESGWRLKLARVATPFEISPPLRQGHTWHQIAEPLPSDGKPKVSGELRSNRPRVRAWDWRDRRVAGKQHW